MWRRSPSFILDSQRSHTQNDGVSTPLSNPPPVSSSSAMSEPVAVAAAQNPNPNPKISAYYQTRAAHHGVVTSDWLAQAQAAVGIGRGLDASAAEGSDAGGGAKEFSVIDEFNSWRRQPDLAEAVAAIRALAAVIRSSEATTMMELEIELKKASDSLKVSIFISSLGKFCYDLFLLELEFYQL